jgi:hypothetical protein
VQDSEPIQVTPGAGFPRWESLPQPIRNTASEHKDSKTGFRVRGVDSVDPFPVVLSFIFRRPWTTPAPGQGTVLAFGSELLISVQYTLTPSVAIGAGEFNPVASVHG